MLICIRYSAPVAHFFVLFLNNLLVNHKILSTWVFITAIHCVSSELCLSLCIHTYFGVLMCGEWTLIKLNGAYGTIIFVIITDIGINFQVFLFFSLKFVKQSRWGPTLRCSLRCLVLPPSVHLFPPSSSSSSLAVWCQVGSALLRWSRSDHQLLGSVWEQICHYSAARWSSLKSHGAHQHQWQRAAAPRSTVVEPSYYQRPGVQTPPPLSKHSD